MVGGGAGDLRLSGAPEGEFSGRGPAQASPQGPKVREDGIVLVWRELCSCSISFWICLGFWGHLESVCMCNPAGEDGFG